MYEAHWNLKTKPFENNNNADFYYPSEPHQSAMLKLRYVIENRRGAALLSGPAGVGKSMLTRSLFGVLPENISPRTHIVFPRMPSDQLLAYIADELTGRNPVGSTSSQESVHAIQSMLERNADEGHHAVLAIDESQVLLNPDSLELIRLLLNFETDEGAGRMTLLLVGQGSMLPAIERVPSLEERLSVKCVLRPFSIEETASYIGHRIQAAGGETSIFTNDAIDSIHDLSGGVPRRINRLCELALLVGYAEQRSSVDVDQVEGVSNELLTVTPE